MKEEVNGLPSKMRIGNRKENKILIISTFGERDKFMVFNSGSLKNLKIERGMS